MADVLPKDILFYGGGLALLRNGTLIASQQVAGRGGEDGRETVSRADAATCATAVDRDGRVRGYAAHHARVEWRDTDGDGILDTPGLLSEYACTPAWTFPEDFSNVVWNKGNASISVNATTAPDGTATADKLVEDGTNNNHEVNRATPALTDNRRQLVRVFARAAERAIFRIRTTDKAGTLRSTWFNTTTGTVGTKDAGHSARIQRRPDGWCECELTFDSAAGATAPAVNIFMATADAGGAYQGDGSSGMYFWGFNMVPDRGVGQSHVANITSSVLTRADEAITAPVTFGPQDLTVLCDFARNVVDDVAAVLNLAESRGVFDLGDASSNHVWAYLEGLAGTPSVRFGVKGATTDQIGSLAVPAGERIRVSVQVKNFSSAPVIAADVGAGLSAFTASTAPFFKWENQRIRLGGITNSNLRLCAPLYRLVIARGLRTRAEMLAIP